MPSKSNCPRGAGAVGQGRSLVGGAIALVLSGCGAAQVVNFPFDPAGFNPSALNSAASETEPAVAGRYVVLVSDRRGAVEIYLYDWVERRSVELPGLNRLEALESSPSLSADGNWLAFAATQRGRTGLFLYNRATRQLQNFLPNLTRAVRRPHLSADGSRLAFEVERNGQWDLAVYERDGRAVVAAE